jgi:NhaP-type Na+/H+ or K+/H+ antiporter
MHEDAIIALSAIGVVAIICQWFAWWVKLPAILFLLLAGIVMGPLMGWLNPEELFGDLLFPLVSLSVAIILFEGALTLRLSEIKGLQKVVRNMLSIGVLVTWTAITLGTHYIIGFAWDLSLLFGALMIVTGPTVIVPMLRTVRPNAKISNILRWEGIVIDPLGAILAVLVFEVILSMQVQGHASIGHTLYMFGSTILVGTVLGITAGYLFGLILRKHLMPEYLHNVATLTIVFGVFALSNHLYEESGLLTVTAMGMWLANMKNVPVENILDFKESLSILLISGLFIILAARLDFSLFATLGWAALGLFIFIQVFARPIKVIISTLGSDLTWQEKFMVSWIGPRGIVAAAVTALFSIRLQEIGVENAELLVPLAFTIIIGTVVLQGSTSKVIAKWLKVAEPEDNGFLIIGANPVARLIAKALSENGFHIMVTDSNWANIKTARMEGLQTYYGTAVSEHADRHLELIGLGHLLALTPQKELNALASQRYSSEFGSNKVYSLSSETEKDKSGADQESRKTVKQHYKVLFDNDVTFSKLASLISQKAKVKKTNISDTFTYEDYQQQYGKRAIPLFAFNSKRQLRFFTDEENLIPEAGWTITSLVKEEPENLV